MANETDGGALRIDRLYMKGVGPFETLDMEFRPKVREDLADLHILVGPNGSGKSTILYALAAGFGAVHFAHARCRYRDDRSQIWVNAGERAVVIQPNMLGPLFSDVQGPSMRFAAFAYSGQRGVTSYSLKAIKEPDSGPLSGALSFAETVQTSTIVQWLANAHTKEALALKDGNQVAAERYRKARTQIEDAIREVTGEKISFEMKYEPLGIFVRRNGDQLDLDLLPDGYKSIISWVADLLSRLDRIPWADNTPVLQRRFLLLLDEVDIHLHPAWQRKILPMVQRLFPNAQIVVSTHSPFVVSSVADAWVYPLGVKNGVAFLNPPVASQAGTSFGAVLRSLFGVREEFDVETEKQLAEFYARRDQVLGGDHAAFPSLREMAERLAQKSIEVADIVNAEIVQVAHRIGVRP